MTACTNSGTVHGMHKLTHSGSVELAEITIAEAVAVTGRDRSTITRWIRSGKLTPTRKLPGRTGSYLLDRSEVERIAGVVS